MILKGSVFSKTLGMETSITVVTPNEFEANKPYKVAYLLHGLCGNSGDWAYYTMLPVYANDYNIIFIMPEVARSFYSNMKYGLNYFSYVAEELPVICKSIFNISAKREDTAVIGGSMGGYGALKCALSKPELYGHCCTFSAPCLFLKDFLDHPRTEAEVEELKKFYGQQLINDFRAIFGEKLEWNPNDDILALAAKANAHEAKPRIYAACGLEDYMYGDNARFRDEMKKFDFDFTYEEWHGNHDWYFFNEALRKSLKFCFGAN